MRLSGGLTARSYRDMQSTSCTNCGKPVREGAQFCPACGSSVATAEAVDRGYAPSSDILAVSPPQGRTCGDCGNSLREGAQFCPVCGSSTLTGLAATPSQTSSSAVPVMGSPTAPAHVQLETAPEPKLGAQEPRNEDSSKHAASIPTMTPPPPNAETSPKHVTPPPDSPGTLGEARLVDRSRSRWNNPRVLAAVGGLLVVGVAVAAVFLLGGQSSRHPAAAPEHATKPAAAAASPAASVTSPAPESTAQPPTAATGTSTGTTAGTSTGTSTGTALAAQTTAQLATLESILNLAETGRQALANGDITATIANRRTVLQELGAFQPDSELFASVQALKAAESYSLHADTTCGLNCSATVDQGATSLKQAFLAIFNPIATRYNTPTYTAGQI